jgi:hypothetical protein
MGIVISPHFESRAPAASEERSANSRTKPTQPKYQALGTARGISIQRAIPLTARVFTRKGSLMMVYQEKIAPPGPLPDHTEPTGVLLSQRTIDSVGQENAWLKEQLAGIVRAK